MSTITMEEVKNNLTPPKEYVVRDVQSYTHDQIHESLNAAGTLFRLVRNEAESRKNELPGYITRDYNLVLAALDAVKEDIIRLYQVAED